jgi:lactoylglutathione lyase
MITNVKAVGVCVSDQSRAVEFYTKVLGFDLVEDEPMGPTVRWIEVAPPGAQTHIALFTPPGHEDRIGTFAQVIFKCDDIHRTFEELKNRGVVFTAEPTDQPGGVMAQFTDQDGNKFVLIAA